MPDGGKLQMVVQGETLEGKFATRTGCCRSAKAAMVCSAWRQAGLEIREEAGYWRTT